MFSLLLSGRLGDMLAPRLDFDEELTSLLKVFSSRRVICRYNVFHYLRIFSIFNITLILLEAGLFDAALTLMKQKNGEMTFVNKLDKSGLALIHIASASGAMVIRKFFR